MSLVCIPTIYCHPGKVPNVADAIPVQDCLQTQPGTLAYFFYTLNKDPNTIEGIELYKDKAAINTHGSAPSFKAFTRATEPLFSKPLNLDFASPVCGFLLKDSETALEAMHNKSCIAVKVIISCKSPEARTQLLQHAQAVIPQIEKEQGTLSYYWSADNKDLSKVHVFERYADQQAVAKHKENSGKFFQSVQGFLDSASIEAGTPVGGYLAHPSSEQSKEVAQPPKSTKKLSPRSETPRNLSFTLAHRGVPQSIAHRGYKSLFPENTLIALEGALKCGADGIETDVHLSRDGVVVIAHDPSTLRCYGKQGNVWDQDFHGSHGMSSFVTVDAPHSKMPTLVEVLQLVAREEWQDKWLLLDIKVDNQIEIIQAMADALHAINPSSTFWSQRVVLGVWHHKFLPYCEKFLPDLGITHIGVHTSYARRYFLHHPAVKSFNLQLYALVTSSQQKFIEDAHALDKPTYVWTVNDAMAMRFCMSLKVDAILSDDPTKTKAVQEEDLSQWDISEYWTTYRTIRAYMFNVFFFLLMMKRMFWTFRNVRSQRYVKPKDLI